MRRVWLVAWVVLATVVFFLGSLHPTLEGIEVLWPWTWAAWAPVGYLILVRRPGNKVGLAAYLVGLSWGVLFAGEWLILRMGPSPTAAWVELVVGLFGVLPWLAIAWLLLVFPWGGYPGRIERIAGYVTLGVGLVATLAFALSSEPQDYSDLPSPLAVPSLDPITGPIVGDSGFLSVIAVLLAALLLLIRRWRRAGGVERHQYRWLLLGALPFVLVLVVGNLIAEDSLLQVLILPAGWAIPVSIGVAVTRYRLYEIDRLLSRTLGYTLVVALLALVYGVGAVWLPSQLLNQQPPLFVAGSTLAVAALFNPVRKRLLGWVDRRFYRSRYDAELVIEDFGRRLRNEVDIRRLTDDWTAVVTETMRPSSVGVWVRER